MKKYGNYDLTYAQLVEVTRPLLVSHDFHDIVRDFDRLTPLTKELLLAMCDSDGNRILTFTAYARTKQRSVSAIRSRFETGMLHVRLALYGIVWYMEKDHPAWTTLPLDHLKLVDPQEYAKRLDQVGKDQTEIEAIQKQIRSERAKIAVARQKVRELKLQIEQLDLTAQHHARPPVSGQ